MDLILNGGDQLVRMDGFSTAYEIETNEGRLSVYYETHVTPAEMRKQMLEYYQLSYVTINRIWDGRYGWQDIPF